MREVLKGRAWWEWLFFGFVAWVVIGNIANALFGPFVPPRPPWTAEACVHRLMEDNPKADIGDVANACLDIEEAIRN